MQGDDPPYLSVGTAVSAKYKGAFCEAKVSKVVRVVKCKVTYKMGLGTATVSDDQIKGTLRVGQAVQAKHPEKKELVDATITKIQDCSQYTVVFDDGDITTLRRSALCLKSGRHFNESETLDQLPLTHPEHFGNPVVGGRRGRRSRQLKEDSSEGEAEEENEPDLELYSADAGRVVSIESSDKKRSKDNWFPGLVVMPSAQPTVRINVKDEYLIRSFKDGRYYTVPKKEVSEFSRELGAKVESTILAEAVEKALKYLDQDELPVHWERNSLFNMQSQFTDSEENFTDSSDDEPCEEKDLFVAQLYKFMDDASTPLNKTPTINNKDVDLYRLFRVVEKLGGYNRVTNQNKWRTVAMRLKFPNNQNIYNQVKLVYKKCLFSYESFYRTLGVTMLNHSRSSKKNRGRSLIRDKDRATPVNNSPRPEKEDFETTEKEDEKLQEDKLKTVKKLDEKKRKEIMDMSDTNSSDATDHSESIAGTSKDVTKSKRIEKIKEKKPKLTAVEKKLINDEQPKKEDKEDDKVTRSKSIQTPKSKETVGSPERKRETRTPLPDQQQATKIATGKSVKKTDDDKKRGRKRLNAEEKTTSQSDSSNTDSSTTSGPLVSVGDKLKVYYGPTHESKVTYEAKVLEIDKDASGQIYLVHYTGWNTRYDEWITPNRIAENLSATTKAKRLKQNAAVPAKATTSKTAGKRGRGMSITGRSTASEAPRSTTPSSVTSSSSRTKSPATPATTRSNRVTRQGEWGRRTRRTSAHTDLSNHSETDTDVSESESELNRTRSGVKIEEGELKTYKKKLPKSAFTSKTEKRKDDEDTEKEDDQDKLKRARKVKKLSDNNKPSEDSDDDSTSPPKGRDFDLNQIRSELKGLVKPVKVNSTDTSEKEMASSDDSTNPPESKEELEEIEEEKLEKPIEKSSSSDDIYEFKEPEPFEFEAPSKMGEDKNAKKRLVPRIFEDIEKSPSPKKKPIKSPVKMETDDKKRYRKTPTRKTDEDDDDRKEEKKVIEDPFDKLVESPSFHIGKATSEKIIENKSKVVKALNLSESLNHFQDLPDTAEEDSEDRLDLSDNEDSQLQSDGFFSESNFSKPSPESSMLDSVCVGFSTKSNDKKQKDSDDDDAIRASIQRVIAQTSLTDEDSNDTLMINQPTSSYHAKKRDVDCKISFSVISTESEDDTKSIDVKDEKKDMSLVNLGGKQISPALQETDSALLESICSQPELITTKLEETKDIKISTGTKIADSLLQKFSMIKNKQLEIKSPKSDVEKDKEVKSDAKKELKSEFDLQSDDVKLKTNETKTKIIETARPKVEPKPKSPGKSDVKQKVSSPPKAELSSDSKKRSRKILSREFIEESDTDSSDSEQLVIARSDEDSQTTSFDNKLDLKESDSNISLIHPEMTDDSQSQEEERNFKFDVKKPESPLPQVPETEIKLEIETAKEEEPDSHLHSLLVCEETIPGSPAPPAEITIPESRPKNKTILEMPFASAPGSSNSKNINANIDHSKNLKEKLPQPPLVLPLENRDAHEVSTVLDNTPPTTPESTFSNLSPRGDNGGLSPNTVDNESWKSAEVEGEYSNQRRSLNTKVSPYSEEDTLMNSESNAVNKKLREETSAAPCKKRRRSCKMSDDIPAKRGRKPLNRSRHNSDSDDTSEHSVTGSTVIGSTSGYDRITRSPRPSKYNFFVELDPNLDSGQRIAVLQQKLAELRKTYADVKAELATIERRRKKLRRREREAMKAAKQEMACT